MVSNLGKLNSSIVVCPFGVDLQLFSFQNSEGNVNPTVNFDSWDKYLSEKE